MEHEIINIKTEVELPVGARFTLDDDPRVYEVVENVGAGACKKCAFGPVSDVCVIDLDHVMKCDCRKDGKSVYFVKVEERVL